MRPFANFCLAIPLLLTVKRFVFIFKGNVLENADALISKKKQVSVDAKIFFWSSPILSGKSRILWQR